MKPKKGLTLAEHQIIGRWSRTMAVDLNRITVKIGNVYGSTKKPTIQAQKLLNCLIEFKNIMDSAYFADCRLDSAISPYYRSGGEIAPSAYLDDLDHYDQAPD